MKVVRILETYNETDSTGVSRPVWVGGRYYPMTDGSQRQIDLRNGEEIEVTDDVEKAIAAAEAAQAIADKAAAKADGLTEAATAAIAGRAAAEADVNIAPPAP